MAVAQRKRGGAAFPSGKMADTNGHAEPGKFHKFDKAAKATKLGTKTKSDGFQRGGTAKAGGGAIDADGIARVPTDPDNSGKKAGGAVAKKAGGAISGAGSSPSLAQRARGGRTSAPFSAVHAPTARSGSSSSGHEGE